MAEDVVTTGVDDLLELLRGTEKIAFNDAVAKLHVPMETLQAWVDFLVEEKIIGIEYKFTKPFIYLNKEEDKKSSQKVDLGLPDLKEIRRVYFERAKAKKIPSDKIQSLWESHIHQEITFLEPFFNEQAQRRGVQDTQERRRLWEEYIKAFWTRAKSG